jgi:hypothetical protein
MVRSQGSALTGWQALITRKSTMGLIAKTAHLKPGIVTVNGLYGQYRSIDSPPFAERAARPIEKPRAPVEACTSNA